LQHYTRSEQSRTILKMGLIYAIACRTCKITRDLDQFYTSDGDKVETSQQALDYKSHIEKDSFRAGLLVSFMAKHMGHDCVLFHENSDCSEELDPYFCEYKSDFDFWKTKE